MRFPSAGSPGDSKIYGIELLRLVSALAILLFHFKHFIYAGSAAQP